MSESRCPSVLPGPARSHDLLAYCAQGGEIRFPSAATASSPGVAVTQAVAPVGPASTSNSLPRPYEDDIATAQLRRLAIDGDVQLTRTSDPDDRRARLLVLTDRGHACTRAAEDAAADTVAAWNPRLTVRQRSELGTILSAIASPGRLRPAW